MASRASRSVVPETLPSFRVIFQPLNQVSCEKEGVHRYSILYAAVRSVIKHYKASFDPQESPMCFTRYSRKWIETFAILQ